MHAGLLNRKRLLTDGGPIALIGDGGPNHDVFVGSFELQVRFLRADQRQRLMPPRATVAGGIEHREPRRLQCLIAAPRHTHRYKQARKYQRRADRNEKRARPRRAEEHHLCRDDEQHISACYPRRHAPRRDLASDH